MKKDVSTKKSNTAAPEHKPIKARENSRKRKKTLSEGRMHGVYSHAYVMDVQNENADGIYMNDTDALANGARVAIK